MGNISLQALRRKIHLVRGKRVMLDTDLAELYDVPTSRLNEQVRRNAARFPPDFMFQLTSPEFDSLRSQFAISKGRGGRRYLPLVFTEQGIAMLSSVLNSERAILVNIEIMRAFAAFREWALENKDLAIRIAELEKKFSEHDMKFKLVFDAIRELVLPAVPLKKRRIGF